jgi:hypothetical protein
MIAVDTGGRLRIPRAKHLGRAPDGDASGIAPRPGYEMREGVERFLSEHPGLRPFLYETGGKLREHFGPDTGLAVERFVDPEAPAAPVELFLRVKTALDAGEARARLHQFEEDFWLDNLQRGDYLLNVALEFV